MATYGELPTLIGKLKRAAIDAYMVADYGGAAGQMWSIEGDRYELSSYWVSRPGENGEGGGDWHGDWDWLIGGGKDKEFRGIFDDIRGRIDGAFDEWTANLPVESEMAKLKDSLTQAMMTLGVSPSSDGGVVTASGPLGGYLDLIAQGLDEMSGATIEAFKAKFLSQLSRVIANQYAMTILIGGAVTAELNMWRDAKQTVADTAQEGIDAMNKVIAHAGPNWDLTLKVVGWAVKGAGIFATGGLKQAADVAGAGVEILTGVAKEQKASAQPSESCASVLDALDKTMKELKDAIKAEEQKLQDNLDANLSNMGKQQGGYDLKDTDLGVKDAQAKGVDMIIIRPALVSGITDTHMPNVASELGSGAESLYGGYGSMAFDRPPGIGIQWGPQYFDLLWTLYKSITDLQWEVTNGAQSLKLAIADLNDADTASQKALDQHRKVVDAGSGISVF